jgi:FAD/FMN-containing dehydrogenase
MLIKSEIYTKSVKSLKTEILKPSPLVVVGAKTSTVLPFQNNNLFDDGVRVINLSRMPKFLELSKEGDLLVRGPVDWKEARNFCEQNGREVLTAPTEDSAYILSGLATSATGERCFGFGALRDQVHSLKYISYNGEEKKLCAMKSFAESSEIGELLVKYQKDYSKYKHFKNAPFPRFEKQTDLMIGTEGQLGVITEAVIKTKKKTPTTFFFILLPQWEKDYYPHIEIFEKVQNFRDSIYSCELIDSNSLSVLPKDENPGSGQQDLVFIEFESEYTDRIFEEFISCLKKIDLSDVFEIGATKCHELRMKVPRLTFEQNSRMGVVKKGTDVQMPPDKFQNLLDIYRDMSKLGINYNLFGHFGDAHLHFNFMPTKNNVTSCDDSLESLYEKVYCLKGSPFAEHGIGLIKKKFIKNFYGNFQMKIFSYLKEIHDPENKFFPQGYMSVGNEKKSVLKETV